MSKPVVAVLGTGIMGAGIARSLLRAGLEVRRAESAPPSAPGRSSRRARASSRMPRTRCVALASY
jgi:3-hydroxyisobutyrate dehydrogenase-like beta-hydroxyacid dehydrogenase